MKHVWRKQKPRTPGFTRAYTMETPLGDILEAEFNFHERLVRLAVEIKEEKGRMYSSTVRNGIVLQEKDISSGRAYPVFRKLWPFRDYFSSLPDNDLLLSVGGCYDIFPPVQQEYQDRRFDSGRDSSFPRSSRYDSVFGIVRETRFQRWKRRRREEIEARGTLWERFKRRFWGDLQDISLGCGIAYLVYLFYYDYVVLGWSLAALGMTTGLLDFLVRKRSVLFTKVLSFLSLGSYFFYTGYVYF
ncbi:hypothetical protein [Leptospira ilyithenensis]|uniref:Uncharacterized protein n=1 Tax=Leptospira ilyithenensis TaxID=2484901 RepID=A0A4R9LIW7_9LEPT|nr:hypothetical protein [Leptospira ilyithenensis]TGN06806.1 hypothetical protein EHS11_16740 [Leptospira ilyithenensis]